MIVIPIIALVLIIVCIVCCVKKCSSGVIKVDAGEEGRLELGVPQPERQPVEAFT